MLDHRDQTTAIPTADVRYIGDLAGRYVLSSRDDDKKHQVKVFACRTRSISLHLAVLQAPVSGRPGEDVIFRFDDLGLIRGSVARKTDDGFIADLKTTDSEREILVARLIWLKRRGLHPVVDRREQRRWLPRVPKSLLHLPADQKMECFIIDVSSSGIAISADIIPELGTAVLVGAIPGRVVRHLNPGFAVQFLALQDPMVLESLLSA
jgi:hypothetical protein